MRLRSDFVLELLGIAIFCTATPVYAATCNADNCRRALFPASNPADLALASAFCLSYTSTINTATTGFPARATSACGNVPSKYSSACSCAPTVSTTMSTSTTVITTQTYLTASSEPSTTTAVTSTSTCSPSVSGSVILCGTPTTPSTTTTTATTTCPGDGILLNGGFECGFNPWVASYGPQVSPGLWAGHSGKYAVAMYAVPPYKNNQPIVVPAASLKQTTASTLDGHHYTLSFWSYFDISNAGSLRVKINNVLVSTVNSSDGSGSWTLNSFDFTASGITTTVTIEVVQNGLAVAMIKIDDVAIVESS